MKKSGRWFLLCLLLIGVMFYLHIGKKALQEISIGEKYISCTIENVVSQEKEEWGITLETALYFLEIEEEKEASIFAVFWRERKSQTIENREFYRTTTCQVIELCGNSSLLYPGEYPLDEGDKEGCLIGEYTAWQLFGDTNVIGKPLIYGKKTYYIRGVLQKKDIFVCQALKNSHILFNKLTFYGEDYIKKETIKEQLGNEYGINVMEDPVYWYFIFKRAALFLVPACLMTILLILSRKKKHLFHIMILLTVLFWMGGVLFIFHITPDKLPNRLSDLEFWSKLIKQYKKDFFSL